MIDIVDKRKFERAKPLASPEDDKPDALSEEEINAMLIDMENPVRAQQRIAVQMKHFLDHRIKTEMKEKGFLSDHTRRWVEAYNNTLEKIQKALYGDKSVNLNLNVHKISHGDIATRIRNVAVVKKVKKSVSSD